MSGNYIITCNYNDNGNRKVVISDFNRRYDRIPGEKFIENENIESILWALNGEAEILKIDILLQCVKNLYTRVDHLEKIVGAKNENQY